MTDDQPRISVILDGSIPSADLSATLASVREQSEQSWELLLWAESIQGGDHASLLGDHRIHLLERSGMAEADEACLRDAVRGRYVAWIAAGAIWPATHLAKVVALLSEESHAVHVGVAIGAEPVATSVNAESGALLAALCVDEGIAVSTLACTRVAFGADSDVGSRYQVCDTWARSLRMVQRYQPVWSTAAREGMEREVTLDLLPVLLSDMLRMHRTVRAMADALPRTRRRQWDMRESLWSGIRDGLPLLQQAMPSRRLVELLRQLADAALDFGEPEDLRALRKLLEQARELDLRDLALHHALLAVERGLDHPMEVVLQCQSGGFALDVVQAGELVTALRQLGNDAAAEQVVALLDGPLPVLRPVATVMDRTHRMRAASELAAPQWLTDMPISPDQWLEVARAYDLHGLIRSAVTARGMVANPAAGISRETADTTPEWNAGAPRPWLVAVDQALCHALAERRTPLAPVVPHGAEQAADGFLEASAQQLEPGAFEYWLHDALLDLTTHARVVQFLETLMEPHTFVDLNPGDGRRLVQALRLSQVAVVNVMASTSIDAAQWHRAVGSESSRLHVVRRVDDLCRSAANEGRPVLLHAALTPTGLEDAMACLHRLLSSQKLHAILWSGTDVPSLWSEPIVQQMLEATGAVNCRTMALIWNGEELVRLPLSEAPRAHLLVTEALRADA